MSGPVVPFLDLRPQHDPIEAEISQAIARVRDNSFYILGPELEAFEEEFARYLGAAHAIGVGNGLDALTLSLRALGIGPGDEVITTPHTFIATVLAISAVGATPVLVDCGEETLLIDPDAVESAITPRTAALIPVHLYGRVADMPRLSAIARRHGLAIVEDAAQAHGARLEGQAAGTLGSTGCFSFYPTKNLGALGDGGAIVTSDSSLAEKLRQLRNYGSTVKYVHEIVGVNSRLDELQAAILRVKLRQLDGWNAQRRDVAEAYYRQIEGQMEGWVELPCRPRSSGDGRDHVHHVFPVLVPGREDVRRHLTERGIQSQIHYPNPVHLEAAYASLGLAAGSFPVAESAASRLLSLPFFPGISQEQIGRVVQALREALRG